jgi:hypothetical protein
MSMKPGNIVSKRSSGGVGNRVTESESGDGQAGMKEGPLSQNPDAGNEEGPASKYIRENYKPDDRLALVVINKKSGALVQRIARASSIAEKDSQRWLHFMNNNGYEVYLTANSLKENAGSRRKEDVENIRHVYLDIDHEGDQALQRLLARTDLPEPNYVLATSPGKYQVIWKVERFTPQQAETLQRRLARDTGADIAVTDSTRLLRLPGYYNHKYDPPHLVEARTLSQKIHRPESFPDMPNVAREQGMDVSERSALSTPKHRPAGRITQSERDWAFARRALSRGESRESVVAAISAYRRFDKANPRRYAEITVDKASQSLTDRSRALETEPHGRQR